VLAFQPTDPTHPAAVIDELGLLLTGGRLGAQTRKVLTDVYTSYVHEQPYNMSAGVAEATATLDTHMVPQNECNYAVKAALAIPVPVPATCVASTEYDHRYGCANAVGGNTNVQWATRSDREGW
jgi:hypothetical protein